MEIRLQNFVILHFSIEKKFNNILHFYEKSLPRKKWLQSIFLIYPYYNLSFLEKYLYILIAQEILYNSIYKHLGLHLFLEKIISRQNASLSSDFIELHFLFLFLCLFQNDFNYRNKMMRQTLHILIEREILHLLMHYSKGKKACTGN